MAERAHSNHKSLAGDCNPRLTKPIRNKQIENGQTIEEIWNLARAGAYLNIKQLIRITNFSYEKFREWRRQGLPLHGGTAKGGGKIRHAAFVHWLEVELPQIKAKQAAAEALPPAGHLLKYL